MPGRPMISPTTDSAIPWAAALAGGECTMMTVNRAAIRISWLLAEGIGLSDAQIVHVKPQLADVRRRFDRTFGKFLFNT